MNRLCDYIDRKIDDGACNSCVWFMNGFIKYVGGVLVYLVYIITIFICFAAFFIILPYQQLYTSSYILGPLSLFGVYLMFNIMYHYYKARTLRPVTAFGREGDRWCHKCEYYKSERTHHCGVCERCVLGMDHHCIWINQCVGTHNHRHFFLFISFLTVAMLTIIIAGFQAAWDHIFVASSERSFCTSVLYLAPLQGYICSTENFARSTVIFCYLLAVLLFCLVGFLTGFNVFLISRGVTYIDYLRHAEMLQHDPNYRNPLMKGFKENWKDFLGLRRHRTFMKHVLLPSAHPPVYHDRMRTESVQNI